MAVKTDDPKKNAVKVDGKPRLSNPFNKRTDIPIEGIITVQGKPDDNYPGFVAPTMAVKGEATDRILGDPNAVKSGPINPHNIGLVIGFPADAIVGREMTGAQIEV